jgi:hypothetical protein
MFGQLNALATLLQGKMSVVPIEDEIWKTTNTSVSEALRKCKSFASKRHFYPQTKIQKIVSHILQKTARGW